MRLVFAFFATSFFSGLMLAQTPAPAAPSAPPAAKPAPVEAAPAKPAASIPAPAAEKPVAAEAVVPAPAVAPAAAKEAKPFSRLSGVKRVYILQMQNGMDQFLASRLTSMKVFDVVTDPKEADAVITDNIGAGFQEKMKDLYPPEVEETAKEEKDDKEASTDVKSIGATRPVSTFSRSRGGNVFVVDQKTSSVLWSIYMPPKSSKRVEVEQTSRRIAQAMSDEVTSKKKNALTWLTK